MTIPTLAITRAWSDQQNRIFDEFRTGTRNIVVVAYAGTGKTTTAIEAIRHAPEDRILMTAFNKRTEIDLNTKLAQSGNTHAVAKTSHAIGFSIVRKYRDRLKVDSSRAHHLTDKVCGVSAPDTIKRLVTKLHTQGRENAPHATMVGELTDLAIKFECLPDDQWSRCQECGTNRSTHVPGTGHAYRGFDAVYVEEKALEAMELASKVQSGEAIDYADMIFLPVRNGWMAPQYDLVVIDEAQDMTLTQLEILQGVCKGRIAVIGDSFQAIYGFRGADSESLTRLKTELNAVELKLSTTYRCGHAIVAEAQRFVPDFQAGPNNHDGDVSDIDISALVGAAGPGNFILSRTNAPLVSVAMKLLRAGKRTRIAGKDIGAGLQALIRKMNGKSVPDLLAKIGAWETRETDRLKAQQKTVPPGRAATLQTKIDGIIDQSVMLAELAEGAKNVTEVVKRIDDLFTDDGLGDEGVITCSSVHKAKGLESDTVFILASTMRSHTQEEKNIEYVAITRAKRSLVWVITPELPAPSHFAR